MKRLILFVIKKYKTLIVSTLPSACRLVPSCSQYTYQAIEEFGVLKGIFYGLKRVLRCNTIKTPIPGTYDPVI